MYTIYSDATQVVTNGNLSYHPIFLTLGNISRELRRKPWSHRLVGFIPALPPAIKKEKKQPWYREAKQALFQECLLKILESTRDPAEKLVWEKQQQQQQKQKQNKNKNKIRVVEVERFLILLGNSGQFSLFSAIPLLIGKNVLKFGFEF